MSLPEKPTKHITRKQAPIGAKKDGKLKIFDGETERVSWRQGRSGFSRDWDGDPTAKNYNRSKMKKVPTHSARMGKRPSHKPDMDGREGGESQADD
jgi:hypothetical protein